MSYALGYATKPMSRPATRARVLRRPPTTVRATRSRSKADDFYTKADAFVYQKTGAAPAKRETRRVRGVVSGFGQAEEASTANGDRSPWPTVIAVGAVGFIGLGLLYGMARTSGPGAVGWGGL